MSAWRRTGGGWTTACGSPLPAPSAFFFRLRSWQRPARSLAFLAVGRHAVAATDSVARWVALSAWTPPPAVAAARRCYRSHRRWCTEVDVTTLFIL